MKPTDPRSEIPASCASCGVESCSLKTCTGALQERPYQGLPFAGWSALFFLLPVLSGLMSSLLAEGTPTTRALGGLGGLLGGMLLTTFLARRQRPTLSHQENP